MATLSAYLAATAPQVGQSDSCTATVVAAAAVAVTVASAVTVVLGCGHMNSTRVAYMIAFI